MPTSPGGSGEAGPTLGTQGATLILSASRATSSSWSSAYTVNEDVPRAVGVPLISPLGLRVSPAGNCRPPSGRMEPLLRLAEVPGRAPQSGHCRVQLTTPVPPVD